MLETITSQEDIQQGVLVRNVAFTSLSGFKGQKVPGICLTPACDLVIQKDGKRKANFVLLTPLVEEINFFQNSIPKNLGIELNQGKLSNKNVDRINSFLKEIVFDKNQRYFRIYNQFKSIAYIIDFQLVKTFEFDVANSYKKAYRLTSSYKERLASKYGAYMGRIGTQDIDFDAHLKNLMSKLLPS